MAPRAAVPVTQRHGATTGSAPDSTFVSLLARTWQQHPGWWLLLAAIVVTALVYGPGVYGSWLFDDYPNIVDNPGIRLSKLSLAELSKAALSSPSSMFKRPMASLSFALNYYFSGLHPYAWKITNVAIHLANGVLVFVLARMLLALGLPVWQGRRANADGSVSSRRIGVLAALIASCWMLLPINLTAVLYVVQRMESMANFFVLAGLIGYLMGRRTMLATPDRYMRGLLLAVLSLLAGTSIGFMAKETAVMLPLYAFLAEAVLFRFARTGKRFDLPLATLFVLILLVPLIGGLIWQLPHLLHHGAWARRDFDLHTRLLSEARIVTSYIRWSLLPTPGALSFYHDNYHISTGLLSPWTTLGSMLLIAALLALAVLLRKRAPLVSLGLLLYFGCQTLTGTILPLELVYEHRNYFASVGLLLAVVPLLAAPRQRNAGSHGLPMALPRYVLLGGLMLLWTGQTAITAWQWGNPLRLAETLAARAPDSPRAQYSLGRTYIVLSGYNPTSPFTQAAYAPLERAAALPHASILPEQALIFLNARLHRPIKAAWWDSMIAKLKAHKPGVQDESSLAALTRCARDGHCDLSRTRMVQAFLAALNHPSPSARLLANYGDYAWNVLGDHALGERMTVAAVNRDPDEPAYHITLGRMYAAQGRNDGVRGQIRELQKLNVGGRLNGSIAGLRELLR